MERRIHRIRRAPGRIENAPARTDSGDVLNHEILRTESKVYERSVRASVTDVRSEFRETGNLRPKVRHVGFPRYVVVSGLVRIKDRSVRYAVETTGSGRRDGSVVEPSAPRSVGVRRPRLVDGRMVDRPVVVSLGIVVAVEVFRKVHRRFRAEGMRDLAGIRTVSRIRHDIETRKRPFFPVPCDEIPSRLVDVHIDAETVRIERRQRGRSGFPERGIGFQNLVRSPDRVDKPIRIYGVSCLPPDQIRTESESADSLRRTVSRIGHDVEVLGRLSDCRSRGVRRGKRFEPRRGSKFEITSGILVESGRRHAALSEIERFGLGSKRVGIRRPRIRRRQGFDGIGSGCRIAVEGTRRAEPIRVHAYPIFSGIRVVRESHDVAGDLRVRRSDRLHVHASPVGENKGVLISGLSVIVQIRGARLGRSCRNGFDRCDSNRMDGIRRSRRIGNGLPIPFSRFGKRLGRTCHLMDRGVRRDFEVHGAIRGNRRVPIKRVERRKNVRRRIGEPVVQIDSDGRSERVSFSGRIRTDGRYGRAAGKIKTVPAGAVRSDELLRTPGTGRGIGLSESFGAEGLPVYEVEGGEVAVVVYGPESSDHIGKRGRIPIRSQPRARMGSRERYRNTLSVHVDSGTVGRGGMIGVPRDDDVVKRRRIAVRRDARIGVIGIPRKK